MSNDENCHIIEEGDNLEEGDVIEEGDNLDDWDIITAPPEEPVKIFGWKINVVLFEIITGILVFGLICQLTIVWFVTDMPGFSIGLWLGIIAAIGYVVHIWWSTGQYLYMGLGASVHARKHVMLRYMLTGALLILAVVIDEIQFLAVFLGIMGVKAGTSAQPFIQKYFRKKNAQISNGN